QACNNVILGQLVWRLVFNCQCGDTSLVCQLVQQELVCTPPSLSFSLSFASSFNMAGMLIDGHILHGFVDRCLSFAQIQMAVKHHLPPELECISEHLILIYLSQPRLHHVLHCITLIFSNAH